MTSSLSVRVARLKQDQVLDAAIAVFARKGFHAASMRDVAAAAGVAPGSIYNHFENKAALLLAIIDRMSARAAEATPLPPADANLRDLLIAAIRTPLAAMTGETTELFRVILAEVLVDRDLAEQFRRRVLDPMLSACGDVLASHLPQVSRDTWLRMVSAIVLGLILQRLIDGDAVLPLPEDLADALLAGLQDVAP
jgi:TetR/AcrR family fatty acid metabolism transcriptional regulator